MRFETKPKVIEGGFSEVLIMKFGVFSCCFTKISKYLTVKVKLLCVVLLLTPSKRTTRAEKLLAEGDQYLKAKPETEDSEKSVSEKAEATKNPHPHLRVKHLKILI